MDYPNLLREITGTEKIPLIEFSQPFANELYLTVGRDNFAPVCQLLHKRLNSSPVSMFFAEDLRAEPKKFVLSCVFLYEKKRAWIVVRQDVPSSDPAFDSLARDIYSASLFEREIKEMFGLEPKGNPDLRRLRLHDEVWPERYYPLRKDFCLPQQEVPGNALYQFKRVEGEGIFEVPVGPVHAGVIGPGHFRFSVAGEPVINLEIRLGWAHRGVEKLLEGKTVGEGLNLFECISGDTAFGYSLVFCSCVEKIFSVNVPMRAQFLRALFLELERIYNHANDIGGIALDVGFSFPAQMASLIKEAILQLNQDLCGSRFLKGINTVGGITRDIDEKKQDGIIKALLKIRKDFMSLEEILYSSVSFMDRVDGTGILAFETARDLGVAGLTARASGIDLDMRKVSGGVYDSLSFNVIKEHSGDVAARLKVRCDEVRESFNIIRQCIEKLRGCDPQVKMDAQGKAGFALGCVEAWRGPVRVWTRINPQGKIERCKIVDPSFQNWEGLSFAVLNNIIPDFPLCNKSFDLSYSGNDL